ncbi:uncharacterized protein N7500_004156 [Penicillium coprophilum]|uniref:uncharacterized protein n=1 Tax=Penicillium coprophilum TaxID=36646 RepID=UPI0023A3A871|nr:uncharacterized protein N7500_004156 [Penicillium coprophilum]KAJ5171373.1 hypothetical protein N7500_004156 [Penicillium coprophilum]
MTTASPPPDGGFHAWAQVVSGHLVVALTWGYASSFGVFQNYYEKTLPQSASDISWIGGFQVFCLLFISVLSGRATNAGLARLVVGAGAVLLLLGTFMTSLATVYWQIFLAQGLCVGIGQGLMWLPSVALISTYFVRLRVFALTAAATGTSTGGIIFPAMIQYLTPRIGFPWAVRCMGFVALVMVVCILALLRPRLPSRKSGPFKVYATKELHLSQIDGVKLIIVINACGIPIRAPCGYLADRYLGPSNCLIPWVALCGILMLCWIAVHTVVELYIFAVFYGLASAAAMALFAGTVPSLTKDLDKIGTRVGMALTLMSFGPLTGPSVAGVLISRTNSYLAAQIWAGVALTIGVLALGMARIIITGPIIRAKV